MSLNIKSADIFFSIVIPVFNRAWSIERALNSAVSFLMESGGGEIVVVDDGSSDNSLSIIKNYISIFDVNNTFIRLIELSKNSGVCAAKNAGAHLSSGEWIIFLDSDDELFSESAKEVYSVLENSDSLLHFFKCVPEIREVVQVIDRPRLISLNDLLIKGTGGEALPVVNSNICKQFPYDEDLQGYEGLAYLRMIVHSRAACLHTIVARRYYTSHENRLSSRKGNKSRYNDLLKGHLRVIREHRQRMSVASLVKQCFRCIKAFLFAKLAFTG